MKTELDLTQDEYDEIAEDAERKGISMETEVKERINSIVRVSRREASYTATVHDSCCMAEATVACTIAMIGLGRMARLLSGDCTKAVGELPRSLLTDAEAKAGGVVGRSVIEALWHVAGLADKEA